MLNELRVRMSLQAKIASVAVLLGVVLTAWLLAAPPGGSPDDGYHLGSIWCGAGHKDDLCLEAVGPVDSAIALVPLALNDITCFAYDGGLSARCQTERFAVAQGQSTRFSPEFTNINRKRPNLYYRVMHEFIDLERGPLHSVGRMRAVNVILTVAMVSLTALVAPGRIRRAFLLSWIVAALPLGLFFATTLSTSAWTIAGLSTVWANLLTVKEHPRGGNRILGGALAAIGIIMALGARTEAVAHLAIVGVSLGAMWWLDYQDRRPPRASRSLFRRAAETAGLGASGIAFLALLNAVAPQSANLDGAVGGFRAGYERLEARGVGDPFLAILFEVPTLWSGAFGNVWGLGVLDTPIPNLASLPIIAVFVTLLVVGVQHGSRGRILAVTLVIVAFLAMPTLSLLRAGLLVYESLQPRQFMAMVYPLLGLALYRASAEPRLVIGRAMAAAITVTLSVAHSISLLVTIQRHTNGLLPGFDGLPRHVQFGREAEWWWAAMPHPDLVWAIGSIAYLLLVTALVQQFRDVEHHAVSRIPASRKPSRDD